MVLPMVVLGTIPLAIIARMTRSSLLEVLGLDYVRTARAKGLDERGVAWRHANVHVGIVAVRPKLIGMEDAGYRPLLSYGSKVLKDRILTGTSFPMQPPKVYFDFQL